MSKVAVIAHAGKSIDGGLPELRRTLARHGVADPLWAEVPKSRKAPKQLAGLLKQSPELVFVWGGDGMAQRCIDSLDGQPAGVEPGHSEGHRSSGGHRPAWPATKNRRRSHER